MTQEDDYKPKQFKRNDDKNKVTCGRMQDKYSLICMLMSASPYIHPIGLAPMHPLIRSMLREAKLYEIVNLYALFRLPQACAGQPDMCLVRQKSYEGYDPDKDKYVPARLGKIVRDIFVSKSHDEITQELERYYAQFGDYKLCFTQSDAEMKELMLWMTEQYGNSSMIVPRSCMTNPTHVGDVVDNGIHPYQAYAHALGWSLAYVPIDPEDYTKGILSRAIVNRKSMRFVRTFSHTKDFQVDERMNHMLVDAGYKQHSSWTGHEILKIEHDCIPKMSVVLPYIDGDRSSAIYKGGHCMDMSTLTLTSNDREIERAKEYYSVMNSDGISYLLVMCAHCGMITKKIGMTHAVFVDGTEGDICGYCERHQYRRLSPDYYADNTFAKSEEVVKAFDALRNRLHNILKSDAVRVSRYNTTMHRKDTVYAKTTDEYIPLAEAAQGDTDWEYQSLVEVNEAVNVYDKSVRRAISLVDFNEVKREKLRTDIERFLRQ